MKPKKIKSYSEIEKTPKRAISNIDKIDHLDLDIDRLFMNQKLKDFRIKIIRLLGL